MKFDPVEFYKLAGDLYKQPNVGERELRTALGRAYYAAFLAARDNAGITTTSDVHSATVRHYLSNGQTEIGNRLEDMRIARSRADYELTSNVGKSDVGRILKLSEAVLKKLGSI